MFREQYFIALSISLSLSETKRRASKRRLLRLPSFFSQFPERDRTHVRLTLDETRWKSRDCFDKLKAFAFKPEGLRSDDSRYVIGKGRRSERHADSAPRRSAMIIGDEQSADGISNFYGAGMKIGVSPGAPFMRPRRRFSSRQRISIAEVDAPRRCAT